MHEGARLRRRSGSPAGRPRPRRSRSPATSPSRVRPGGRLHLCHLSTARAVDLVRRAKAEGVRVTAEVTPHHLTFTDEDLRTYDTHRKMNPPLRTAEDRAALCEGVADGTIDVIATDHAPHAVEEKEAEFDRSPPGTIGLETALAVVLTELVHPGVITLARAIEALSAAPGPDPGRRRPRRRRSSRAGPRTSSCSTRTSAGRSSRPSPRRRATARSRVASSAAACAPRCSAARSRSPTGSRPDERADGAARARGRHDVPRDRLRRRGRDLRRGGLQHGDGRVPGGPHRPVVRGADRGDDGAASGELRHRRRGRRVMGGAGGGVRRARGVAAGEQLAGRGHPAGRGSRRRGSWGSRAWIRAR